MGPDPRLDRVVATARKLDDRIGRFQNVEVVAQAAVEFVRSASPAENDVISGGSDQQIAPEAAENRSLIGRGDLTDAPGRDRCIERLALCRGQAHVDGLLDIEVQL